MSCRGHGELIIVVVRCLGLCVCVDGGMIGRVFRYPGLVIVVSDDTEAWVWIVVYPSACVNCVHRIRNTREQEGLSGVCVCGVGQWGGWGSGCITGFCGRRFR